MKRKTESLKLKNSPLVLVLAQVQFGSILKMGSFIPDIQEALRTKGYPRFELEQLSEVTAIPGGQGLTRTHHRWIFTSQDRQDSIVLSDNFLVLETSDYDVFEDFIGKLSNVLAVLEQCTKVSLVERVGLRYIDLIRKSNEQNSRQFLKEKLQGLEEEQFKSITNLHNTFLSQADTPYGRLVVRSVDSSDGRLLPPDLDHTKLKIGVTLEPNELVTFLDIDHYSRKDQEFNLDALIDSMWELHEYTDYAFRAIVKEESISYWRE